MKRFVQFALLASLLVSLLPSVAHGRVYDPRSGRWLTRDPMGFVDGGNRYEYVRSNPVAATDPAGLQAVGSSCVNDCIRNCPTILNRPPEQWMDPGSFGPDDDCVRRCETLCGVDCPTGACTPQGTLTWSGPNTVVGLPGASITARLTGEDPTCCSEIGVVQFVRYSKWPYGFNSWQIDDGRVGLLSDPSPYAPLYTSPARVTPNGLAILNITDNPGFIFQNALFHFTDLVVCTEGKARGHIYRPAFEWLIGTSLFDGAPWFGPTGGPLWPPLQGLPLYGG